ncbi:MAG: hypothetical protein KBA75_04390 [Alphaproteobacteria bacterium]|nr:hypothetical protein [Alphaproteobacteria bacterium]
MMSWFKKLEQQNIPPGMSDEDYAAMQVAMKPYKTRVGIFTVIILLAMFGSLFLFIFTEPMRAWETMPLLFVLTTPLTYFLVRASMQLLFAALPPSTEHTTTNNPMIQRGGFLSDVFGWYHTGVQRIPNPHVRRNQSGLVILHTATISAALMTGVLAINHYADTSEPKVYTIAVESKYISHGKHGSRYYKLRFPSPVDSILPFAYDTHEIVQTNRGDYDRIVPGQTTVTIEVHSGALGLPWFKHNRHYLDGLADGISLPSQGVADKALAAACTWRDTFNLQQEIPPISTNDFHRDYWPNGKLRSEEPLVNGAIHGVGHYWFDDGRPYANIPYRQGKKHGTFTLYRQDGTVEQQLSYKDGVPYGINAWMGADGQVSASYVFISEGEHYPVTDCQKYK